MSTTTDRAWSGVGKWSARAFLVAGVLALGYAVLKGLKAYAGLEVITVYDVLYGGFVLLVPAVALLGLSLRLREGSPWLSVGAIAVTLIAGLGTVAIVVQTAYMTLTTEGYPEIPGDGPAWPVFVLLLVFVTLALGFLLSGIAAWRTEGVSGTVAGLLVVPFLSWFGLIVANVVLPSGDYLGLFAYAPIGAALLTVGYLLRTEGVPTDRAGATPDSTA